METLKNVIDWIGKVTAPMRLWKGGEDGKYIHILIGAISVIFIQLIMSNNNAVGLSFFALFIGIAIEVAQNIYMGGKNTLRESIFDSLWTWVGGTIVAYGLYALGYVDLYYVVFDL